jgi:sodium-dependent phosphate cotransporter
VHDFFHLIAVALLLPLELATGFLSRSAEWLTGLLRDAEFNPSAPGQSPIRAAVRYPVRLVADRVGEGGLAGAILLAIGLALVFLGLALITKNMRTLVASGVERTMNRVIGTGGGAAGILVGLFVTIAVQSSSITTSILVPLVASGLLSLPSAFSVTVGANVGTTVTALLASMAVLRPEGLTIALVHTLFNLTSLLVIFSVPMFRRIPVWLAERLAAAAIRRRSLVIAYVLGVFLVIPLLGMLLLQ